MKANVMKGKVFLEFKRGTDAPIGSDGELNIYEKNCGCLKEEFVV